MALGAYLCTDDLTILLGLIAIAIFLLESLYKPQPLVHPILLGRQSEVGRVRNAGESALYRNYAVGLMGRVRSSAFHAFCQVLIVKRTLQFPVRPEKGIHLLSDLVKPDFDTTRTLWSTKVHHDFTPLSLLNLADVIVRYPILS